VKKLGVLLIVLLMFGLVLGGCSSSSSSNSSSSESSKQESSDKPKVTVVLKTLSSQYWKFVEAGAKQAFKDQGVDGEVIGPSSESQVIEQVNMMQDVLSKGTDALVVAPSQPSTAIPVLEKFANKGIPVLLVDTDVKWDGKTTFIGTQNYTAGQKAGETLASMVKKGGHIALIAGALGNPATDDRIKGAKDYLEKHGYKIVAEQPADSDRAKGMSVMTNILQTNPDLDGVYAANDDMALGALRAVKAANKKIPVIGTDGTVEAVQSIIDGGLAATIAQMPYDMGYQGVVNAVKAIKGEKVNKRIDSGVDVINKDNAAEKIKKLKEMLN
jgi:ribose transport system substrate-binding protein